MDSTKKRNRIPSSCSVCRKRKSKCDRVKPICGSCKKKSIAHLCFYENEKPGSKSYDEEMVDQAMTVSNHMQQVQQMQHPPQQKQQVHQMQQMQPPPQQMSPAQMQQMQQIQHMQQMPPQMTQMSQQMNQMSQPPPPMQQMQQMQQPPPQMQRMSQVPMPMQMTPIPQISPGTQGPSPGSVSYYHTDDSYYPELQSHRSSASSQSQSMSPSGSQMSTRQQILRSREHNRSIVPPPNVPPTPSNIPMPQQVPRLFYDQLPPNSAGSTPLTDNSNRTNGETVQLPPLKNLTPGQNGSGPSHTPAPAGHNSNGHNSGGSHNGSGSSSHQPPKQPSPDRPNPKNIDPSPASTNSTMEHLITVPIGPSSSLKINPNDEISESFANASIPLSLEGPYIQSHGYSTYVGLSRADKYVKYLRAFAVHLLKTGVPELQQPKKRKKSNASTPMGKKAKTGQSSPMESVASMNSDGSSHSLVTPMSRAMDVDIKPEDTTSLTNQNLARLDHNAGEPDIMEEDEDEDEDDGDIEDKVNDGEDIMLITRMNVAKERRPNGEKQDLAVLPGLKALYSGPNSRKDFYKIVKAAVLNILPNKQNLAVLFQRYWKWVNLFIPILNESSVVKDLNQIFDDFQRYPTSGERLTEHYSSKYTALSIKSDKHLLSLGILLLTTRLGYMSLIHNQSIYNQYDDSELEALNESKDVSFKTFDDVVNLCIPEEHTSHRSSLRHVQILCLLHFYREVSPNNCLGVGTADSQILFGTIVRHALSMGLNRDPSKYVEHDTINNNKELYETWRTLWHYIAAQDANQSIHRMSVLNIYDTNISDNKFSNSSYMNEDFKKLRSTINEISKVYRRLSLILTNYVDPPKVISILKETNQLEHIFFNYFGKDFFSDFICTAAVAQNFDPGSAEHIESFLKVSKFLTFMQLRTDLSTIYFVIAMNYESSASKHSSESMGAGVELFKIHFKSIVQLVYIMSYVFDNSVELFGRNYDYILTAFIERYSIKTHSFLTSFFIRLIAQKQILTLKQLTEPEYAAPDRLHAVNGLFTMILTEAGLFVGNFRTLSLRYVNSYKIYILTYYVLKQCMENPEIFFQYAINDPSIFEQGTSMLDFFSAEEINYLTKLCEEFRLIKDIQDEQRKANTAMMSNSKRSSTVGSPESVRTSSSLPPSKPGYQVKPDKAEDEFNEAKDFHNKIFRFPSGAAGPLTDSSQVSSVEFGPDPNAELGIDPSLTGEENFFASMLNNLQSLTSMTGINEFDIKGDDFLKYMELYGDVNMHLE